MGYSRSRVRSSWQMERHSELRRRIGSTPGWSQGARSTGPALASALHGINDSYRTVLIALGIFGLAILASLHADALRTRGG